MDYMLVCYNDDTQWNRFSPEQQNTIVAECDAYVENLDRSGHLRSGGRLQGTSTATTLRSTAGKPMITDGPFAETKEVLAGFVIVTCKDRDEAIAIAERNPRLRYRLGSVEVRPMLPSVEATLTAAKSEAAAAG